MWPVPDNTNTQDSSDSSDDDVLRAVLDFVESFDSGHATSDHTTLNFTTTGRSRSHKQKRHSSERTKSEIRALRELAAQLQDRVAHLQYEETKSRNVAARDASHPSCWEIEALRQEEERLRAEMENLELKRLVEAQATVAQRLQVLFRRRVESDGVEMIDGVSDP